MASYNTEVADKERLAGVHLDLEPYTLGGWLDDHHVEGNLVEYLTTIAEIVGAYRAALGPGANRNLQLGLAIPFWFDGRGDAPDEIELRRRHQAGRLPHHRPDGRPARRLPGDHGLPRLHPHLERVDRPRPRRVPLRGQHGARSGLVVGQQYSPVPEEEEHTTFNGQPRWGFWRAAAEIALAFRRYPQFRGLSVDDIDAFMAAGPSEHAQDPHRRCRSGRRPRNRPSRGATAASRR